jgi:repressor LexA
MARYLTKRQREILEFMMSYSSAHGVSPTHREICDHFGYSSYGTVHKHLRLLEEKGYLKRNWNQKRGVELDPEALSIGSGAQNEVPFLGLIAAGRPIEAVAGNELVTVPALLLGERLGEHFVLRVVGDSMIDEGIHDGDLVVVVRRQEAVAGEMVVALVGDEATLKRFYPEGKEVRLQPSNARMQPIRVPASNLRIQGVVVGLMRKF